jgi:hypothetical protein
LVDFYPYHQNRRESNESGIDSNDGETKEYQRMPVFHPSDIIGKTFLMDSYRKMVNAFERESLRTIEDRVGDSR